MKLDCWIRCDRWIRRYNGHAYFSIAEKVTKQRKMKYNVNDDIYFTQQPKPDPGSGVQREPLL